MTPHQNYLRVTEALEWLATHRERQPDLDELAAAMGLSAHHLQRVFQRWAGISPKQFLKALTRDAALERLRRGETVLDAALGSGLSGPGRLHDLVLTTEALTPGEARRGGAGVTLRYGFGDCLFGRALIAWSDRGVSFLGFCNDIDPALALAGLRERWPNAQLLAERAGAREWLDRVFDRKRTEPLPVWLRGSPFQLRVWEALLAIPEGAHASYGAISDAIDAPGSSRAVGNAVGKNPVAWLIPCHRVIRRLGELGGYRWGAPTKRAMIAWEHARPDVQSNDARSTITSSQATVPSR